MTENIPLNKSTNSVYEYSNSFDVSVNSNLDNNVLQHSKLNGDVSGQPESGNTCGGVNDKKSFHITSVTVQHNSTEGNADESADESRTEELSDNIDMSAVDVQTDGADLTDNIIGKDDVLYKVTSVGSAPIIPTSAQYGIAVVSNCNNDLPDNISKFVPNDGKLNDTVKRTEFIANGLEINGNNIVPKELNTQIKNERFKVVKIESNEPFKRGRWVCMDFSDQSMDQLKKSTISINDNDKSAKKDTPEKEICPAEVLVNGTVNMENMSSNKDTNHGAVVNEAELKVTQTSQVNDSAYHNGDMSGMNSVSPNQTFSASFVPPSNVSQPQAQSLTHIIVPQSAPTQVASGSYGHSQSLPHSELQHVHQAAAQQQQQQQQQQQPSQQGIHVVTSLQQSFHPHPSMQHSQGMMTQGMQHMGGQQQQQQQSDNVYSQPAQQSSISVQQQPMMQQQSYPTLQQNTMTQQPAQCTNQRVPTNAQPQQQQQMSNPHCLSQIPQQQSGQQNGDGMMGQQNQSAQYQQSQSQQTMQQTLQHTMQQVPLQQQSFQHTVPAQSSQPPMIHQQQPVQPMPTQHHSPQQPQQQQQTNQPQQSMPTQQNPTSQQVSSQSSLPPTNIQQPVMQQNVPHSLPQQQQTVPAPANVQYLSQQQQPTVIPQANQQPGQQVINAPPVQQQPMMQQQMQPNADPQLHMSVQQQLQHQSQPLPQSGQQQQILQQQMPSQMPQQQQQSQMQQMQHIPQQTQPQMNQQPATQQQPMQQQQIPQQIAQHHQQIIQPVPQQQQAPQQQPQQMMQSQQMAPQTQAAQQIPVQQPATFQNAQQPSQPPSQQVAAQVMVGNQQIPQMQQQQQAPQQQSHQMQQPPSSQPIQHSFPPQQVQQPTYQSPVPHQNVSGQLTENIPVSGAQTASYQHDVSVLPTDVMMSNVQPSPNQYAIGQPQNISVQTQLPLHVSLHQSYQTANQPHYVNASNVGMLSNCNTSMAGQQTPPISQPQYFSHSVTQSGGSITSQDLQQLCGHQHHQANQNVSSLVAPLISTVSSQNLPPNVDYGQQYSVHYQNGTQSQSSTNVQTQTTPISQSCSTTGVPMQQFTIQQSIPSVLSSAIPVPVSSSYLPNIGSVHPNQLQQTNYLQNVATPPNQMYSAHQTNVSFADAVDQYHLPNVHLPEQVSENVKVGEEVNFHRHDDADSTAGGSNAVAIDNKIEQAMDLVKSHLMFAVREEVEVLKEKIAELMDRINQLEIENSILKANASQETLAQLPTHTAAPSTVVSNTTNSTPASIGPTNGQPP